MTALVPNDGMPRMFPALLKYWRGLRGFSQLDLAHEAKVAPRHVSFLETGRAQPGEEMVLRLFAALRAPLRDQNAALRAAGFAPRFPEPGFDELPPEVAAALDHLMAQHEPYPLTALALDTEILRANRAAQRLLPLLFARATTPPRDMVTAVFDPGYLRPFITNWSELAATMLARLQREHLERRDERLADVIERALGYPGVPGEWARPDLARAISPVQTVRLARGELRLGFLIAITTFSAPQQVTLEELRLEAALPLDDETRRLCHQVANDELPRDARRARRTPPSRARAARPSTTRRARPAA